MSKKRYRKLLTRSIPMAWSIVLIVACIRPATAAPTSDRRTKLVMDPRLLRRATPLDAAHDLFSGTAIPEHCAQSCGAFQGDLPECEDDRCACSLVPTAQICAECVGDWPTMERYNALLDVCAAAGFVREGATTYVETATATGSGGIKGPTSTSVVTITMTGSKTSTIQNATVTSTITVGNSQTPSPSSTPSSEGHGNDDEEPETITQVLIQTPSPGPNPSLTPSGNTVVTVTMPNPTVNSTGPVAQGILTATATSSVTPLGNATANATLTSTPTAGANSSTDGALKVEDGALKLTQDFFAFDVQLECEDDCSAWSELEDSCDNDECVCTAKGLQSASKCSSCISQGEQGDNFPQQMIAYGGYRKNCTAEYPDVVREASASAAASASATPTSGLLAASDRNQSTRLPNSTLAAHADGNDTQNGTRPGEEKNPDAALLRSAPWPAWAWQYGPALGAVVQVLLIGSLSWAHILLMG